MLLAGTAPLPRLGAVLRTLTKESGQLMELRKKTRRKADLDSNKSLTDTLVRIRDAMEDRNNPSKISQYTSSWPN